MLRKQKEDSGLEDPSCSKGLFQDRRGTRGKTLCDRILSASAHPLFSDLLPPFTTRTHETKLAQPNCFLSNRLASTPVPENFSSPSHRWRTEPNRNKRYENSRYRCKLNFTLLGKRLSILSLSLFLESSSCPSFVENHCQERVHFLSPPVASNGVKLSGRNSTAREIAARVG